MASAISELKVPFDCCFDSVPECAHPYDDVYHRVFLTTNETGQQNTFETLSAYALTGNTFIGVSCFGSLNIVAERVDEQEQTIDHILMLDRSNRVEHFWKEMQQIMASCNASAPISNQRLNVVDKVKELITREKERYFNGAASKEHSVEILLKGRLEKLDEEITEGISWLSANEKFSRIKTIFDHSGFAFKRVDLSNELALRKIGDILRERGDRVDTVYVSNILEYLGSNLVLENKYFRALDNIVSPGTFLVHAKYRKNRAEYLTQAVEQRGNGRSVSDIFHFSKIKHLSKRAREETTDDI